jgi:beta-lactamase class A
MLAVLLPFALLAADGPLARRLHAQQAPATGSDPALETTLRRIAAAAPGTLGIRVQHVESGRGAGVHADEWFPLMSAYKLPIAVHVLRAAARGEIDLDATIRLTREDRRPGFSPLARTIEQSGNQTRSGRQLLSDIIRISDNTASDRLLRLAGGPAAVLRTLRQLGIDGIDVSRYELQFAADYYGVSLDSMRPFSLERFAAAVEQVPAAKRRRAAAAFVADRRDSATPAGFAAVMVRLAKGELLDARDTRWLIGEMFEMHTRDTRLRAGLPAGTPAALRPGTSGETDGVRGAHNDSALVTLPDGTHLVVVAFLKSSKGTDAVRDACLASVARAAYAWAAAP